MNLGSSLRKEIKEILEFDPDNYREGNFEIGLHSWSLTFNSIVIFCATSPYFKTGQDAEEETHRESRSARDSLGKP